MKIISKFKDYYDYLQGIYGMDEKIVYRRSANVPSFNKGAVEMYAPNFIKYPDIYKDKILSYSISVCGEVYKVVWYKGIFIHSYEEYLNLKENGSINSNDENDIGPSGFHDYESKYINSRPRKSEENYNEKYNAPIVLLNISYYGSVTNSVNNIRLSDFDFGKIMKPHDIYLKITEFLSKEPEVIDTRTNEMKIESYGFDKKHSFRNTK